MLMYTSDDCFTHFYSVLNTYVHLYKITKSVIRTTAWHESTTRLGLEDRAIAPPPELKSRPARPEESRKTSGRSTARSRTRRSVRQTPQERPKSVCKDQHHSQSSFRHFRGCPRSYRGGRLCSHSFCSASHRCQRSGFGCPGACASARVSVETSNSKNSGCVTRKPSNTPQTILQVPRTVGMHHKIPKLGTLTREYTGTAKIVKLLHLCTKEEA